MKKILIAVILIVAIGGYALWASSQNQTAVVATSTTDITNPTSAPSETTNPAASVSNTASSGSTGSTGSTASAGQYKDGTYTGSVADAFYGNLQVSATISGGKLTDVTFMQVPNDQHESQQVNGHSSPILKYEAIAAQSANVNIVSGATQSSKAFRQSLGSALAQARV